MEQPLVGSVNKGMKVMLQGVTKLSVMKSMKYIPTGSGSVQLLHFLLLQMLSFSSSLVLRTWVSKLLLSIETVS